MQKLKRRTFSGHVCEQEIYYVADEPGVSPKNRTPRLRFQTEEQRAAHRDGIARRAHTRAFNANFSPSSLYATLTFDDGHEVHTFADAKRLLRNYIRRLQRRYPEAVIFAYLVQFRTHIGLIEASKPTEKETAEEQEETHGHSDQTQTE